MKRSTASLFIAFFIAVGALVFICAQGVSVAPAFAGTRTMVVNLKLRHGAQVGANDDYINKDLAATAIRHHTRVNFKGAVETSNKIRGMKLREAKQYLRDVVVHKRCVPIMKYTTGSSPTAQARKEGSLTGQGRWPAKACGVLYKLLVNCEGNAEAKGLRSDRLFIIKLTVSKAPKLRNRVKFFAFGRLKPLETSTCHIQLVLQEKEMYVPDIQSSSVPIDEIGGKTLPLIDGMSTEDAAISTELESEPP